MKTSMTGKTVWADELCEVCGRAFRYRNGVENHRCLTRCDGDHTPVDWEALAPVKVVLRDLGFDRDRIRPLTNSIVNSSIRTLCLEDELGRRETWMSKADASRISEIAVVVPR